MKLDRRLDLHVFGLGGNNGLLGEAHLGGEGGLGLPLGGSARSGLLHHLVDLLQGETLGLGNQEVGVDESAGTERAPDVEHLGTEVALVRVNHVGGDDGNDLRVLLAGSFLFRQTETVTYAVPEPVGGGGKSDTAGTDRERVDLSDNDPSTRSPGAGEEEDVDADERDHGADGVGVLLVDSTDDSDDELADNHAEGTPDEQGATTELLNGPEGDGGGADVDNGRDHTDQERVVDGVQIGEEGGSEVEHEVDTGPSDRVVSKAEKEEKTAAENLLLHHLKRSTEDGTAQVAIGSPEAAFEAVEPAGEVTALGDNLHLVLVIGNDLSQFLLDIFGFNGLTANTGQHIGGLVQISLLHKVTRRFRQNEETSGENQGPCKLQRNRDAVGA